MTLRAGRGEGGGGGGGFSIGLTKPNVQMLHLRIAVSQVFLAGNCSF